MARRKKRIRLNWRIVRKTKRGRKVEEAVAVKWSNAKSGLSGWLVRNRVSDKVRTLRPDRFAYTFLIDFRFQFPGKKIIAGTLDIVPDPRELRKRFIPARFVGSKAFRRGLNKGAWLVYQEIVRSLLLGNRGQLPSYTRKLGRKPKFRTYRKFELRLRFQRIARPKNGRRKRGKRR